MNFLIVLGQFFAAWTLGFVGVYALGIGNGWEVLAIPLGMALGVWGIGALGCRAARNPRRLARTVLGAAIGAALMVTVFSGQFGFAGLLLPLAGAYAGYWLKR